MQTNFLELKDLPVYEHLEEELYDILKFNNIKEKNTLQICINHTEKNSNDILYGTGSTKKDWNNSKFVNGKYIVKDRDIPLKEEDFKFICNQFKNTTFEEIYDILKQKYNIGRFRIMISKPKTCLTWHKDITDRIHFPIKTQEGCFMIIENEIKYLEENKWYYTKTKVKHTAFNGSFENRIHLVACVI